MRNRLYKAQDVFTDDEIESDNWVEFVDPNPTTEAEGAPEGWDEYCLDKWGEPREFFVPSDRPIYRSRSSAQARVDLINRWGGTAVLVECTPEWVPVSEANRRRKQRAIQDRIDALHQKISALRAQRTALENEEVK